MKRIITTVLVAALAALSFNSCETMDPEKDFSGTVYGLWIVDKLDVDATVKINGETSTVTSTTDFSKDHCRLNLDPTGIATLWYNLKVDIETFTFDKDKMRIEFKEAADVGDNGKAIVLLGIYDVELKGDQMIFRQPEAAIGTDNYGASERATYTFHRAPKAEDVPKTAN